jgi:hypothetical protein
VPTGRATLGGTVTVLTGAQWTQRAGYLLVSSKLTAGEFGTENLPGAGSYESGISETPGQYYLIQNLEANGPNPENGSIAGNQLATFSVGPFLDSKVTNVYFDDLAAEFCHVTSNTQLVALTRAHSAEQNVQVVVEWDGGSRTSIASASFDYLDPSLLLASSAIVSEYGNSVTITATAPGMTPAGTAYFVVDGGSPIPISFVSGQAQLVVTDFDENIHHITATAYLSGGGKAAGNYSSSLDQVVVLHPGITSDDSWTSTVGTEDDFTITTTGFPVAHFSVDGEMPPGFNLVDNGDGTATLIGAGVALYGGEYEFTIVADNGSDTPADQEFILTVNEAPAFINDNVGHFLIGASGTFDILSGGFPSEMTITKTGSLPSGLSFTDNEDGTATISARLPAALRGTITSPSRWTTASAIPSNRNSP